MVLCLKWHTNMIMKQLVKILDLGHYADFGIQISPEMVEGLTIGYGFGELEPNTSQTIDNETIFVKYAVGGFHFRLPNKVKQMVLQLRKNDESTQVGVFLML